MSYCLRNFVVACSLSMMAVGLPHACGQDAKQGKAPEPAPQVDGQGQPAPAKPRKPLVLVTKQDKFIVLPDGQVQKAPLDGTPPAQPVGPSGGRAGEAKKLFKELADGDTMAWTVVIGMTATIILAAVVGLALRATPLKPGTVDPAQIVAAWQNQRGLCFLAAAVLVIGVLLGGLLAVAAQSAVILLVSLFLSIFVGMVMLIVNLRCPACGAAMGKDWSPAFCAKCGVALKETAPPPPENSPTLPN